MRKTERTTCPLCGVKEKIGKYASEVDSLEIEITPYIDMDKIEEIKKTFSDIDSLKKDKKTSDLFIHFKNGKVLKIKNASETIQELFLNDFAKIEYDGALMQIETKNVLYTVLA